MYFECTVTWPMMLSVSSPSGEVPVSFLNGEPLKPSHYVNEVYNYLYGQVVDFLTTSAK